MTKAAVIYEKGGPEVFKWEEIKVPSPGPFELLIKNTAIGINYVDTYHRRGMPHPWPVPDLPLVLGFEGVGLVKDIVTFSSNDLLLVQSHDGKEHYVPINKKLINIINDVILIPI